MKDSPMTRSFLISSWLLAGILIAGAHPISAAQPSPAPSTRTVSTTYPPHIQRIAEAAKLWGRLRWVHPSLADGSIDWDQALADALPALSEAKTSKAQKVALEHWLACLHDPALRVGSHKEPTYVKPMPGSSKVTDLPGGGRLVSLHDPVPTYSPFDLQQDAQAIQSLLQHAKFVVFDIRPSKDSALWDSADYIKALVPDLIDLPVNIPARRFLYDVGWPSQSVTTDTYYRGWMTQNVSAPIVGIQSHRTPMAFIVDASTTIPPQVLALQKAGLAYIVEVGDASSIWMPVETRPFGDDKEVTFRVGEWLFPDGTTGFGADRVIGASPEVGPDSPGVRAALDLLHSGTHPGSQITWKQASSSPSRVVDKAYKSMVFPALPWRQLAVIKFWSVIDAFYPYKDLMDRPWSEALPEFLVAMEHVKDGNEYAQTLARMAARLQDNHVWLSGHPFLDGLMGEAGAPISFRMVEHSVRVDQILDPKVTQGIHRWDEVLEVDGEPVKAWMARMAPYVPAANPWTQDRNLLIYLGRGKDSSQVQFKIKAADGSIREFQWVRSKQFFPKSVHVGETVEILPGNIGYVDLGRLMPTQVDAMFDQVKNTQALIFDMRGYPNGTFFDIAPRLNVKEASSMSSCYWKTISGTDAGTTDTSTATFLQKMPPTGSKPLYRGKVVMLINEVTLSQAEHTGLAFEAACELTFIGSPTAGSNGDVTDLCLPGGVVISFTGLGIKHADGRQLQRVGLQPDIPVSPTVKGLRAGKDEVLDRALAFLREGR